MKKGNKNYEIDLGFTENEAPLELEAVKEEKFTFPSGLTENEKKEELKRVVKTLRTDYDSLELPFLKAEIYQYSSSDVEDATARIDAISHQLLTFEGELLKAERELEAVDNLDEFYHSAMVLKYTLVGIMKNVKDAESLYYGKQSLTLTRVLNQKTMEEIVDLKKRILEFISQKSGFLEAGIYAFYETGSFIEEIVEMVIRKSLTSKLPQAKLFKKEYFYETNTIVTLTINEWVDIYNRIVYVMNILNDVSFFLDPEFKEKYLRFELYYLVVLMNSKRKENFYAR